MVAGRGEKIIVRGGLIAGSCKCCDPPRGTCCRYPCDKCDIFPLDAIEEQSALCDAVGSPEVNYTTQQIQRAPSARIKWADGFPEALDGLNWVIVYDESLSYFCDFCEGPLYQAQYVKWRHYIAYIDCDTREVKYLASQDDNGLIPLSVGLEAGTTSTGLSVPWFDVAGEGWLEDLNYPAGSSPNVPACRPASLPLMELRGRPKVSCAGDCSYSTEAECLIDNPFGNWRPGFECLFGCPPYNPLP